jgi:hypothetical protein
MNPHLITWEIRYVNGDVLRERDGIRYDQIPRRGVRAVELHSSEHASAVLGMPVDGSPNFFYRRRTKMVQGGPSRILYILGIWPGFAIEFDPMAEQVNQVEVDIDPLPFEPFAKQTR